MAKSKNPARQIVDTIKKITTDVGVVKDLYGDSFMPVDAQPTGAIEGWYFFKISSNYIPALGDVYSQVVADNVTPETLPVGGNNKADLGSTVIGEDGNNVLFLLAGIEVPRALETNITIECENADILLYVNNRKVAEESGLIKNRRIFLDGSTKNLIQVLIRRKKVGGTKVFYFDGYIQLDPTIPLIFSPLGPGTVEWADSGEILYGSLDGNRDHVGLILTFKDNPFAAGWVIDRYSYKGLGVIFDSQSYGHLDSGNYQIVFSVSGSHTPENVLAVAGGSIIGHISDSTASENNTSITVDISEAPEDAIETGMIFYEYLDTANVASVDRRHIVDLGADIKYVDTSVIHGMPYSYKIAARPIHDKSLVGPYSDLRTADAFDDGPPGPIILWPDSIDAISSEGPLVTVQHIYPADEDLAGYKIYVASGGRGKESYTGGEKPRMLVDLGIGSSLMRLDGYVPSGVNPISLPERYGEFDFYAKEIKKVDASMIIDGYICTTYDYAGNELSIPSGTEFTVTFLVLPPENFTSFDNLVSPALGHRRPDGIPEHMWLTALDLKMGQETSVESL